MNTPTHRGGVDVMDTELPTATNVVLDHHQQQLARRAATRASVRGGWTADLPDVLDALGLTTHPTNGAA